jgi:hypothetical protein
MFPRWVVINVFRSLSALLTTFGKRGKSQPTFTDSSPRWLGQWFRLRTINITMKNQYILFQRAGIFYCEDTASGQQSSLRTKDKTEALRLLNAKNEAVRQPAMNM